VASGWNVLANPLDVDFVDIVRGFQPSMHRPPIFGQDVADRMVYLMETALRV